VSEEPVVKVKRVRRSRAAMQAPAPPITAKIHLKGRSQPLVVACYQATQTANGWVFMCPSPTAGMVKTIHVSGADVVELDRWPEAPVFREAPPVPQEAPQGTSATPRPSGPKIYVNPFRAGEGALDGLPAQGRAEAPFKPVSLTSFSSEPFGVPDGAAVAAG